MKNDINELSQQLQGAKLDNNELRQLYEKERREHQESIESLARENRRYKTQLQSTSKDRDDLSNEVTELKIALQRQMKAYEIDQKNYEEKLLSLNRRIHDLEDSNSSSILDSSDKINKMNRKIREQRALIDSLTKDLKDSVGEINKLKSDSEDKINALITQRNVFTTHIEKMDENWREEMSNVLEERDSLKNEVSQLLIELKKLKENPSVISARLHAREMEEKLKSNEKDMNRLMESIRNEKRTLINRVHDQALTIHDLTETEDKDKEVKWIDMASTIPDVNISIENTSMQSTEDIMNTPLQKKKEYKFNEENTHSPYERSFKTPQRTNASIQYHSIVNSPLPDFLK